VITLAAALYIACAYRLFWAALEHADPEHWIIAAINSTLYLTLGPILLAATHLLAIYAEYEHDRFYRSRRS
jgi:hypothetical protein